MQKLVVHSQFMGVTISEQLGLQHQELYNLLTEKML